jgi:hypothetical protein
MKAIFRLVLPVVFAAWLALPGVGSDGGDNAGGTGVWILPRATFLASDAASIGGSVTARLPIPLANASSTITLTAASEMGSMTATMIDPVTGVPVSVPTNGHQIVIKDSLLTSVRNAGVTASIVVVDSLQQGYVIRIAFEANGTGTIRVY